MCLALRFWDGSYNRHRSCSITAPVPSLLNTRVKCPPRSPEQRHGDLPDGLLYGLQPRPAVREEVEHAWQQHRGMASSLQHL